MFEVLVPVVAAIISFIEEICDEKQVIYIFPTEQNNKIYITQYLKVRDEQYNI